jgi:hypothetical protein
MGKGKRKQRGGWDLLSLLPSWTPSTTSAQSTPSLWSSLFGSAETSVVTNDTNTGANTTDAKNTGANTTGESAKNTTETSGGKKHKKSVKKSKGKKHQKSAKR